MVETSRQRITRRDGTVPLRKLNFFLQRWDRNGLVPTRVVVRAKDLFAVADGGPNTTARGPPLRSRRHARQPRPGSPSSSAPAIHVHIGPARWAARGPARIGTAQTQPGTTISVPVPARHDPRAVLGPIGRPTVQARARAR
jgi:hypothetical protein